MIENSSDDEDLRQKAFDIRHFLDDGDDNDNLPPTTGMDYLKKVIKEAKNVPAIVVADIPNIKNTNKPSLLLKSNIDNSPFSFIPNGEWQKLQETEFSKTRQKLFYCKSQFLNNCSNNEFHLPSISNLNAWLRFCLGESTLLKYKNHLQSWKVINSDSDSISIDSTNQNEDCMSLSDSADSDYTSDHAPDTRVSNDKLISTSDLKLASADLNVNGGNQLIAANYLPAAVEVDNDCSDQKSTSFSGRQIPACIVGVDYIPLNAVASPNNKAGLKNKRNKYEDERRSNKSKREICLESRDEAAMLGSTGAGFDNKIHSMDGVKVLSDCLQSDDGENIKNIPVNKKPNSPTLNIVCRMNQPLIVKVLSYFLEWMRYIHFDVFQGQWIYALLACLEKPLEPDTCSILRDFVLHFRGIRSKLKDKDDPILLPINLLICIIALYFGQLDLADHF